MTIQFKTTNEAKKFARKCIFVGCCANALFSYFDEVTIHTSLYQVEVVTNLTVPEVEQMLNDANIKFNWVSRW